MSAISSSPTFWALPPETLNLHVTGEGYLFEPNYAENSTTTKPTLQILRPSGNILINEPTSFNLPIKAPRIIYGILGLVQLLSGPYLIVVRNRKLAAQLFGHYIWRITETDILPCSNHLNHLTTQQREDEERYVGLLKSFLTSDGLYYCRTLDLTRSIGTQVKQAVSAKKEQFMGEGLLKIDPLYLVNRFIASPFLDIIGTRTDTRLEDFVIFCIEGFVELATIPIGSNKAQFGIISRRATSRVGTRYHSRGIDDKGNVSNFVEAEQLLVAGDEIFSFVQVRGSIPLFWRQNINIRYKPPFEFYNYSQMASVFGQHFDRLISTYGTVTAVNLVDQRGWEGQLAREYAKQVRDLNESKLHYIPFDFHKECAKLQWHRIGKLLDQMDDDLLRQAYFRGTRDSSLGDCRLAFTRIASHQQGVVRTNCIDCLDRTNVVQSYVGRRILTEQLRQLGWLDAKESIPEDLPQLDLLFKQIWADNGDALSKQYAGTGALKADFTRAGRLTRRGLIADGLNSLIRYYLNNFTDGQRQDAMDLFYGHYTIRLDDYYSPFIYEFDNRLLLAPLILVVSFLLFIYLGLVSRPAGLTGGLIFILVVVVFFLSAFLILQNGIHYVQYPRLRPPPVISHIRPFASKLGAGRRRLYDLIMPSRKVHVI